MPCPYRKEYRHDGGTYFGCVKGKNNGFDCEDSYSDFYCCNWWLDIKPKMEKAAPILYGVIELIVNDANSYLERTGRRVSWLDEAENAIAAAIGRGMNHYLYRCKHCGEIVSRQVDGPPKKWIKSYCERTGKDVHLVLVDGL